MLHPEPDAEVLNKLCNLPTTFSGAFVIYDEVMQLNVAVSL
jgi:hypothetical protein